MAEETLPEQVLQEASAFANELQDVVWVVREDGDEPGGYGIAESDYRRVEGYWLLREDAALLEFGGDPVCAVEPDDD